MPPHHRDYVNVSVGGAGCTVENAAAFDKSSWAIAVSLAAFAALLNNVGVNLQKLAWIKKLAASFSAQLYRTVRGRPPGHARAPDSRARAPPKYWLLGMLLIALASAFDFAALAFGPQSVIAPLGSLTIVANAFVAPAMLGERLHAGVLLASVVIVAGCTTAVAAASHSNVICDIDSLFALYWTRHFIVYALTLLALVAGLLSLVRRAEALEAAHGFDSDAYQALFKYHRISYPALSGVFGSQSVLFARTVSEMMVGSARGGRNMLLYPGTFAVAGALASCVVLQVYFLNLGLSRFESLYVVPMFTSTWIVGTALGGGVFYGEFADFSLAQAVLFPAGVGLCLAGLFLLVRGAAAHGGFAPAPGVAAAGARRHSRSGRASSGASEPLSPVAADAEAARRALPSAELLSRRASGLAAVAPASDDASQGFLVLNGAPRT